MEDPCPAPSGAGQGEPVQLDAAPDPSVAEGRTWTATLATSCGNVVVELDGAAAPAAVASFVTLAQEDFFAGTPCHRLTTQGIFVLQCGDPSGDGTGGPGYRFADENLEGATYPAGTVAMANSGPGTNGSQFFLVYKDSQLPPDYTPFGRITQGLEVLDEVAAAGSTPPGDGAPKTKVAVQTLRTGPKQAA